MYYFLHVRFIFQLRDIRFGCRIKSSEADLKDYDLSNYLLHMSKYFKICNYLLLVRTQEIDC